VSVGYQTFELVLLAVVLSIAVGVLILVVRGRDGDG
jgi:hypothetical protein